MLTVWMAMTAALAGDGFDHVRDSAGCAIFMRPKAVSGVAAMRAVCDWPDVDPERLTDLLSQFHRYSDYVFAIDVSRVERTEADGRKLIYQRQEMFGISDREVLLWMRATPRGGGTRFSWTVASDEPLQLRKGAIRTPKNDGFWEVMPREGGGARVVHEIAMDGGGSIPQWLINLVRTRGFARVMSDVRQIGADASG
ncbi:MAG: hypothetical protein KTR31_11470 [Myxococcales bacterium]|nr:hypothetical protein [Myxococcales bacterium]